MEIHNFEEIVSIILFAIGFTTLLLHKNLFKKIIGFDIMDCAIFLFLASKGYITGRTAPIVINGVQEVEAYINRLNNLESLALSYPGVIKTYAIQAGRELRVIVGADKVTDDQACQLSLDLSKKIQEEMTYPGQIKITVIRETRAVNYAK